MPITHGQIARCRGRTTAAHKLRDARWLLALGTGLSLFGECGFLLRRISLLELGEADSLEADEAACVGLVVGIFGAGVFEGGLGQVV